MHLMMPEEPNQEFLMESSDLESLIRVGEAHANNFGLSRLKSISITETEKG